MTLPSDSLQLWEAVVLGPDDSLYKGDKPIIILGHSLSCPGSVLTKFVFLFSRRAVQTSNIFTVSLRSVFFF